MQENQPTIWHTIFVICAWCKKVITVKDGQGTSGFSHGICECCAVVETAKAREILRGQYGN